VVKWRSCNFRRPIPPCMYRNFFGCNVAHGHSATVQVLYCTSRITRTSTWSGNNNLSEAPCCRLCIHRVWTHFTGSHGRIRFIEKRKLRTVTSSWSKSWNERARIVVLGLFVVQTWLFMSRAYFILSMISIRQ